MYADYALRYGIMAEGEYDLTAAATRAQFAAFISAALPDEALEPINDVEALPDVAKDELALPAILRLYNAGVLTGFDQRGSFHPDEAIPREQVAAIMTRAADRTMRKAFTLEA